MKVVPLNRDALKRVGVTLHKSGDGWWLLSCDKCGAAWALPKHIIPISYWQCSNRCNCPKPKPAPKPAPESEPEEDPLEKAISAALAGYNLYQRKLRQAQTDEETEAHRRKSEEYLDEYLALVETRNAGDPPEPKNDKQARFEEAFDRHRGGKK